MPKRAGDGKELVEPPPTDDTRRRDPAHVAKKAKAETRAEKHRSKARTALHTQLEDTQLEDTSLAAKLEDISFRTCNSETDDAYRQLICDTHVALQKNEEDTVKLFREDIVGPTLFIQWIQSKRYHQYVAENKAMVEEYLGAITEADAGKLDRIVQRNLAAQWAWKKRFPKTKYAGVPPPGFPKLNILPTAPKSMRTLVQSAENQHKVLLGTQDYYDSMRCHAEVDAWRK
jgi:hypothetical protein